MMHRWMIVAAGLAAGAGLASCAQSETTSRATSTKLLALPAAPADMPRRTVYVGDFSVSPAVIVPPEMRDVGAAELVQLAREHIRHELAKSGVFDVTFGSETDAPAGAMPLTGEITRVELTGDVAEQLSGFFGQTVYAPGQAITVRRDLVLAVNYRVLDPERRAVAVGTGQSKTSIPVSGTYAEVESSDSMITDASATSKPKVKKTRVLNDAKVERSGLAPAFQVASNAGAVEMARNAIARWQGDQAPMVR